MLLCCPWQYISYSCTDNTFSMSSCVCCLWVLEWQNADFYKVSTMLCRESLVLRGKNYWAMKMYVWFCFLRFQIKCKCFSVWQKLKSRDFLGLENFRARTRSLSGIPNSNNSPERPPTNLASFSIPPKRHLKERYIHGAINCLSLQMNSCNSVNQVKPSLFWSGMS